MKNIIILALIFISSCSSTRVIIHPQTINDQTISFVRGGPVVHSQATLKPELTIIDYSIDEMLIGLSVTNTTPEPIRFSEKNVQIELLTSNESQQATVYSFEQLNEAASESGDDTLYQAGNTAVGIGVGFIPFGGIAYSVGQLLYSLGDDNENQTDQNRIDALTYAQLHHNYLRKHTLDPESSYAGILKIGFENDLQEGDIITFHIISAEGTEKFNFTCKNPPK